MKLSGYKRRTGYLPSLNHPEEYLIDLLETKQNRYLIVISTDIQNEMIGPYSSVMSKLVQGDLLIRPTSFELK